MKINVIVTTYNHEKYIAQCLESIIEQKGNFQIEVIVGDDASTDNTRKIVDEFQERYPKTIIVLPIQENLGVTKNLKRCLDACSGEYIAICEGDDYWTDEYKLQKQLTFMERHQDFSMCFSALMLYHQDLDMFEPFQDQLQLTKNVLTTEDLILMNSIGNFSCCMYRAKVIRQLPDELFDLFTVDWMFNMVCGEFGKIGFIRDWMTVYRKHTHGVWAGRSNLERITELLRLADDYNRFFRHKYSYYFQILHSSLVDIQKLQNLNEAEQFLEVDDIDDNMLQHRLHSLRAALTENLQTIHTLSMQVAEQEQEIQSLLARLNEHEDQINAIHQSTSWKITQPIRNIKSVTERLLDLLPR
jgi:glycosyltransferase involved in cell wall biosynthesis